MRKVRTLEPEGFTEFWAIWQPIARRNDGRGLARNAFRKHILDGAEPADLIDAARYYVRGLKEKDLPFVPLSSTWLNRGIYVDACLKEREYQATLAKRKAQAEAEAACAPSRQGQTAFLKNWKPMTADEKAAAFRRLGIDRT